MHAGGFITIGKSKKMYAIKHGSAAVSIDSRQFTETLKKVSLNKLHDIRTNNQMKNLNQGKHNDGAICPEGTIKVHPKYKMCCEEFGRRTLACYYDIRYEWWPKSKGWFIIISPQAGGGGIRINYCPHCSAKLNGKPSGGRISVEENNDENKFVLRHLNVIDGDEERTKFIGIFDSKEVAKVAMKRLQKKRVRARARKPAAAPRFRSRLASGPSLGIDGRPNPPLGACRRCDCYRR